MDIKIKNALLCFLGMTICCVATWMAVDGRTADSLSCFLASMLILAFSNLDRFASFKALGFEANMRELDSKIKEADAIIKKLTTLSTFASRAVVDLTNRTGRLGVAIGSEERFKYVIEVREHLKEMGVEPREIREVLNSWVYYSTFDLMNYVVRGAGDRKGVLYMAESHLRDLQKEINKNFDLNDLLHARKRAELQPEIYRIEAWIERCNAIAKSKVGFFPEELQSIINDAYWLSSEEKEDFTKHSKPIIREIANIRENLEYHDLIAWSRIEGRE